MALSFGHGKNTEVLMSGLRLSNYLNSIDISRSADTAESTVFNSSGFKSYVSGNKDATLSAEGLFDGSPGSAESTLNTALGSSAAKIWTVWPQGSDTGKFGWGMSAYQTSYDISSPVDGVVSISVDSQSNVAFDRPVSLFGLASISSSSGNGNNNDNTSATTNGGVGYIQRTDTGGGTIATAVIQHSSAAATWATLVSFSAASAQTGQRVAVSGSVKRYTRFKYTLSGTTVAATVNVGFYRK